MSSESSPKSWERCIERWIFSTDCCDKSDNSLKTPVLDRGRNRLLLSSSFRLFRNEDLRELFFPKGIRDQLYRLWPRLGITVIPILHVLVDLKPSALVGKICRRKRDLDLNMPFGDEKNAILQEDLDSLPDGLAKVGRRTREGAGEHTPPQPCGADQNDIGLRTGL